MSAWFPRPHEPRDIRCLGPSGELEPTQLFSLLCSPSAVEWRDKVGVTSPADGSAKSTTRLLYAAPWVFKTDTTAACDNAIDPAASLSSLLKLAARAELWHPSKRWFLLCGEAQEPAGRRWWPVSVCPRLLSLRTVGAWPSFARLWASALSLALSCSERHGVGLDLNPSNFGFEPGASMDVGERTVWYLDDETYAPLELTDVAEAIVGRIPEWPDNDETAWRELGRLLRGLLEPVLTRPRAWPQLSACVREVLLAPRWHPARAALLAGIEAGRPHSLQPRAQPHHARRWAVFADVHANLPALEAVIADADRRHVDGWLFLGDAVGYGPHPRAVVQRIAALPNFIGVRGNHDHMACFGVEPYANEMARQAMHYTREILTERERQWLAALPIEQLGDGWLAVHGAPIDPTRLHAYVYGMSARRNLDHLSTSAQRLCFNGHTHVPMIYRYGADNEAAALRPGSTTESFASVALTPAAACLVNPGSVGQPRDGDCRAAYAIWDRDAGCVEFVRVEYDVAAVMHEIRRVGLPDDLALRLELGR